MESIKDLRNFLADAMKDIKDGKMNIEQARMINELGRTIVDTAKVEVDLIRSSKSKACTDFISKGIIQDNPQLKDDLKPSLPQGQPFERPKAEYTNNGHQSLLEKYGK